MRHLDRRAFVSHAAAGVASLTLGGRARGQQVTRPNVLFIAVDDLNDWLGCLGGHPQTLTPNFDRLAARGTLFNNCNCAAPLCNPSRAALMTGLRPSTTGVYDNNQDWRPPLAGRTTLPQQFMKAGYSAIGGGKIYHGGFEHPASWQSYFPSFKPSKPPDPLPDGRPLNGLPQTGHFDWGPLDVDDPQMGDYQVVDWALSELARSHDQPFFQAVGLFRPHLPWYVPRRYFDRFPLAEIILPKSKKDDLDDVPEAGRRIAKPQGDHAKVLQYGQWEKAVQAYLASINFVDAQLGRLLDGLDASAYRDNTVVVLWGDHGWHLGEKLHWRKFALWEEATQCPLMMSVPGLTKPGSVCARPVNLLDLYPTLLDICALPPDPDAEGVSLRPVLADAQASWERPTVCTFGLNNHSVRSEGWRYIRYADGSEELYDHRADKDEWEWTNLAAEPQYEAVKAEHQQWLPRTNAAPVARSQGGSDG